MCQWISGSFLKHENSKKKKKKKALQGNSHIKCSLMQCLKIHLAFIILFVLCHGACPESNGHVYGAAVLTNVTNAWFNHVTHYIVPPTLISLLHPSRLKHSILFAGSDSVLKWAYSPYRFFFHCSSDLFLCQPAFNSNTDGKGFKGLSFCF